MTSLRPRALLFDWDNTLVDTWGVIHYVLAATFRAMGREPWSLEDTRRRVRHSTRDAFPLLFGERAEEAMSLFYETYEAVHLERLTARAGAEESLRRLSEAGYLLAVVSNKRGHILRREASHLGWEGYFHRLVGADDATRDKPAPEAVDLALADSGIRPGEEVWFVGDTDIDMLCAANAGCVSVLLRAEPPAPGEFELAPPSRHLHDCGALSALLVPA